MKKINEYGQVFEETTPSVKAPETPKEVVKKADKQDEYKPVQ